MGGVDGEGGAADVGQVGEGLAGHETVGGEGAVFFRAGDLAGDLGIGGASGPEGQGLLLGVHKRGGGESEE